MVGQLNGQWIAHLLNLGYIFPKAHVRKSIEAIFNLNVGDSKIGATNLVSPDGKRIKENKFDAQSTSVWAGECYAFASLAIYEGFKKEALKLTKKLWDGVTIIQKDPWNQGDSIDSDNGNKIFGNRYMRNMAIWGVLLALAKVDKRIVVENLFSAGERRWLK